MYLGLMDTNASFVGIDCGTQGTKALVVDAQGTPLGHGYAPHRLIERESGAREQEPAWWVEAMRIAVKQALAQSGAGAAPVRALGVSGQQHGLVVLDEAMRVIRPAKLWNDTETAAQNAALIARFGGRESFFARFGVVPLTGYTVSKLLWLAEREPEQFARIRHILLPHEYLNYRLTGRLCAEYGDASGTAYFDVRSRGWIREVLDAIDGGSGHLFAALPQLIGPDELVGTLRAEVAQELGLTTDCVVCAGGGDNMMGAIGTGNVREGIVTLSLGTSSTVYSFRESAVLDPTGNVAPFCSSSSATAWLPLVCTMNATNVVTQMLSVLGRTVGDIEAALHATSPGADGLSFVPYLNGERTPDLPLARGTLVGLSANNFTAENLIRAAIEGVSFGILNGLALILRGAPAERIRLIGGGARSAEWRQLLADATGAVIEVPAQQEAGCLGAAMQAMFASGQGSDRRATFAEIAARCVRLDGEATAVPESTKRAGYAAALELFQSRVHTIYGV